MRDNMQFTLVAILALYGGIVSFVGVHRLKYGQRLIVGKWVKICGAILIVPFLFSLTFPVMMELFYIPLHYTEEMIIQNYRDDFVLIDTVVLVIIIVIESIIAEVVYKKQNEML